MVLYRINACKNAIITTLVITISIVTIILIALPLVQDAMSSPPPQPNSTNIINDQAKKFNDEGMALVKLRKYNEAIILFDKALAINPSIEDAIHFKSLALEGVNNKQASSLVKLQDQTFSTSTVQTGDVLNVTGVLQSLVNKPLIASLSLFNDSTNASNTWDLVARDPQPHFFNIEPLQTVPYLMTMKALEPGVYHLYTVLNIKNVGTVLAPPLTVIVTGPSILKSNTIYNSSNIQH